jgi:thiamine-phosphate pyrophosphorylase
MEAMAKPEETDETRATLAVVAAALNRRRVGGTGLPPLLLLTDTVRLPDPLAVLDRLPAGSGVILRHYEAPGRADLAHRLAAACRERGLKCLIGGDVGLARAVRAHGVHWPARLVKSPGAATSPANLPGWIVTAAAHDKAELHAAAKIGAAAALLSPVFATQSHPGAETLGFERFQSLAAASPIPVYALGGITAGNAKLLTETRAIGIAGIKGLV